MNNILVVNINWLGDAVFSVPVFKALKRAYPRARTTCLCVPRVQEVLQYCPHIDKIMVYDERGRHAWPWGKWSLIEDVRREKFDAAFLLHRSMTRALIVFLAGVPLRVGYSKTPGLLTHPVAMKPEDMHRSDYYLRALEGLGIEVSNRLCELRVRMDDMQALDVKLVAGGITLSDKYVVLNPGGNWDLKRWPAGFFASLARRLNTELGLKIILSGAGKDVDLCRGIARDCGTTPLVLAGQTSLGESLALYRRAAAVISGDSGPLHLAQAVGANVVGIFGATRPEITGPRGMGRAQVLIKDVGCNKAPCYHLGCPNNVCMQAITVDDVLAAFQKIRA